MSRSKRIRPILLPALAAGIAAAAGCAGDSSPGAAPPRTPPAKTAPSPSPIERLSSMHGRVPAPADTKRNPFEFGANNARGRGGAGARGGQDGDLPELPMPLPRPQIRLLGIATDEGDEKEPFKRSAVLVVGGELVIAPPGTVLAGRFRLVEVGEREVEIVDEIDKSVERLPLP